MTDISRYSPRDLRLMILRLRFPAGLEQEFMSAYNDKAVNFNRFGGFIFVLLYFFNVFTDLYAFPELKTFSVVNRTCILFYGIFCFAVASIRPLRKFYTGLIVFGYSMVCLLLIVYGLIGTGTFRYLYHSGFMLVLIGFFVLRIRFHLGAVLGFLFVLLYIVLNFSFNTPERFNILLHNSGNIAGMYFGGMIISYLNEYQMRSSFIQMLQLENEKAKVEQRNLIIEHDLTVARRIQKKYIPAADPAPNIHSLYRPMDKLGGDFFDFLPVQANGEIGIFISDVSGHGVTAAFITSMLKTTIVQAGERATDPALLMDYINDSLRSTTGDNFITALYGILDADKRLLRYSNAGHNPPIIISKDGVDRLDTSGGFPLAAFSRDFLHERGKNYFTREAQIPEKSKILFYTDGLVEARSLLDPEQFFEYSCMDRILVEYRDLSPGEFLDALYRELVNFRGSDSFDDDVCMICVDVR